jgi:hypothetical protein
MKKVIMLVAALALIAGSVNAGPVAYMGLYTDDVHSNCRADVLAPYAGFTCWHWVLPSDFGAICAEFMIALPAGGVYFSTGSTVNPGHSVALGDPLTGVSICFPDCQTDWFWTYQLAILPTVTTVQMITVEPHPDAGVYQVANCEPGYPLEPVTLLNNLHINEDCVYGNETSSWGAIKGMYSE